MTNRREFLASLAALAGVEATAAEFPKVDCKKEPKLPKVGDHFCDKGRVWVVVQTGFEGDNLRTIKIWSGRP